MMFLNWAMLIGLVAVAIPVIIHLLNRQRATLVDWGAMRFLLDSLTMRRRRILLEEIILMALRCLALALLVLAMAEPILPSRSSIPWAAVLPALLVASILAGVAAAVWSSRRARWTLLAVAGALVLFALGTSGLEAAFQEKQWSLAGGERDVAIVIDGSASMAIPVDGRKNFDRAIDEARAIVSACRPADAICILLAGPVPRPVIPNPITDREELLQALHDLQPSGGSMRVIDALSAAAASLAEGGNPAKNIVLLTDGQNVGWDGRNEARWKFLASGLAALPTTPQVVCRTFRMPSSLRNAAVGDIRFSRKVVGTDRAVGIEAAILNTGTTVLEPASVDLILDGAAVGRQDLGELAPGTSETVRFDHRFLEPGPHLVTIHVLSDDELPLDNRAERVLPVIDRLPVLIVEGEASSQPLGGAAAFIDIALAPVDESVEPPAPSPDESVIDADMDDAPLADEPAEPALGNLVEPRVVRAADLVRETDLARYGLVILANVGSLPADVAERLAGFVSAGGGLLIVPGDRLLPAFYDAWRTATGRPVTPARALKRRSMPDSPAHLGLKTLTHPAVGLLADAPHSDAERALVKTYWTLAVDEKDPTVRVGGRFDTGDPVLVERRVGEGYVLMTALALDRRESNLPSLKCFVPLVHELAYYLAAPALVQTNVRPGSEFVMELPAASPAALGQAAQFADLSAEVTGPRERRLLADLEPTSAGLRVTFPQTYEPGLYRLILPRAVRDAFTVPAAAAGDFPFVVLGDADEGRLAPLTDADLAGPIKHVNLFRAETTDHVIEAVTGEVPHDELARFLLLALVVGLLAEVGLTRWIATQRRLHRVETVSFGSEVVDADVFRARAKEMLATDADSEGPDAP